MIEYLCLYCRILLCGIGLAFCPWCGHSLQRRGPAVLSPEQMQSSDTGTWSILSTAGTGHLRRRWPELARLEAIRCP